MWQSYLKTIEMERRLILMRMLAFKIEGCPAHHACQDVNYWNRKLQVNGKSYHLQSAKTEEESKDNLKALVEL
jgi:hypothetical protein